jgi:hypothetical protein
LEKSSLDEVANRLIVARLFAQAAEQAGEEITKKPSGDQS